MGTDSERQAYLAEVRQAASMAVHVSRACEGMGDLWEHELRRLERG